MANPTQSSVIAAISLNPWNVNKSTNESLAAGYVYFWKDNDRTVPKLVYQQVQTGTSPNTYDYVPLSDPLILSGVGTFVDDNGNQIAVYYYPFADDDETIELYYVSVYDGPLSTGLFQYDREAWPPLAFVESEAGLAGIGVTNQISNSQFVDVNFIPANGISYAYSGAGTTVIPIAPNWLLNVTHSSSGTITVDQTAIAGSDALPNNPPFVLEITVGATTTALTLTQQFTNNPDWGAPQSSILKNSYVASTICVSAGMSITINYIKSDTPSTVQQLLTATNNTSVYTTYENTVLLNPASNANDGNTGYDTIQLVLPTSGTFSFSNVQVMALSTNVTNVQYAQDTANRQKDYLFHYYNDLLQFKPIESYLIGWDFPLNPAQPLGDTTTNFAIGANKSVGTWDQTIIFQSVTNGFTTARLNDGSMALHWSATGQLAIIQYLDIEIARTMFTNNLSVMLNAYVSSGAPITGTVSLYYGATIPDLQTNLSLVATLDANGKPATFNNSWTEIPRNGTGGSTSVTSLLGNATFTIPVSSVNEPTQIPFNGWTALGGAIAAGNNYFAIVVGTASVPINTQLALKSISTVPGDIATIPAPKTIGQTLQDCERYYRKSFAQGVKPAQAVGLGSGEIVWISSVIAPGGNRAQMIPWDPPMRVQPIVTFYNPAHANAQAVQEIAPNTDCTATIVYNNAKQALGIEATLGGGVTVSDPLGVHYTADGRLGYV